MTGTAPRAPTIRRRLAMLVLAAAAPVVLLAGALLGLDHRRDREALERDSIAQARAMAHTIDRELVSLVAAAEVLATSRRAQAGDLAGFYAQAQEVVGKHIGTNVLLTDTSGQQLINTLRPFGAPLPKHGNLPVLRQAVETGLPVVSDIFIGGVMKRPLMSVDVPVFRDGKVAYVLSIGEVPERFLAILNEQKVPEGWIAAVFDRAGNVVARTHEHARFVAQPAIPELRAALGRAPEGVVSGSTLEGIDVLVFYSRSPETGWSVGLAIPRDLIATQLWQRTRTALAAVLVIVGLGLLLAWNIGGSIAESILGLEAPAAHLGRGEEVSVPPLGLREADDVGAALVRASRMLASAEHRAHHDALTGLANRVLFRELALHHIERSKRSGGRLALLYLDLDGFKAVNDRFGHDAGDRLLVEMGERLQNAVRGSDVAARIGGDEFAMLLEGADAEGAAALGAKLNQLLAQPYEIAGEKVYCPASIGTAVYPEDGATPEELLRAGDAAMYRVKAGGRPAAGPRQGEILGA